MSDEMQVFDRELLRRRRDRAAKGLVAHDFLFQEVATRLSDRLLDVTRRFPLALDLGCRTGRAGLAAGGPGGIEHLIRVESSFRMAAAVPGPAIVADAEYLPLAEGRFDLVYSNLDLHWANDLPGALVQIRRALKPDGLFLGAMLGGETLTELRDALMMAEAEITGGASPRISPFADLRDVGGLMQRAGFALPVIDGDRITVTYENIFSLMADLRGMGETNVAIERLKQPTRRGIFIRAGEIYQDRHGGEDGRIFTTFQVIYLHGWAPHEDQPQALRPGAAQSRLADALGVPERSTGEKAG